jgi:RNA polymerase sigma factor (sigma-70 family)
MEMTVTAPPTLDVLSDRELVRRYVRRRDEPAFAALVRRHGPLVLGVCQRVLRHRQDVEDAFQATFLVLARDAHRVKKRDSLSSWLHGVAYRTSLRAAESRHRRIRLLKDVTMIEDSSLADVALRHERQLLDEELQALPEKYRAPLVLHYLESKTARQVADELKLSVSTVEGRLKRGRKELQLRLVRRGVGLSVALAALPFTPSVVSAAELETLVGHTIHAGLSYTAGDPAGPLFTHHAARLAAQETLAMSTTTSATLTAILLVPVALAISNHGDGIPASGPAPQIATALEQPLAQFAPFAATEIAQAADTAPVAEEPRRTYTLNDVERRIVESARRILEAAEKEIVEKLGRPISLHFDNATLSEVIKHIATTARINVVLDNAGLWLEKVKPETPVSIQVDGVQLRGALDLILKPLNLRYVIEDEVLKITSAAKINRAAEDAAADDGAEEFGELALDGRRPAARRLPDGRPAPFHFKEYPQAVARIEAALEQETSIEFVDTPLSEAVQYISNVHHITIMIDKPELTNVGIATDEPVNLIISDIKLESMFNLLLEPLELTYLIRDEVLMITTTEKAENTLETRVYDLRWLPPNTSLQMPELLQSSTDGPWKTTDGIGGTATPIEDGLIVRHTQRMHREITQLLEQLRRHAEAE